MDNKRVKIFTGSASPELAKKIAASFGSELGNLTIQKFSDGEFTASFEETVRGQDVFLIQPTFPPVDNLFELLLMIDAAKRASARQIVAVMPYFGFARQDRKDKPRVAIGSKLVADMLTAAGVTRIMTMDLHADQIQGFFEVPVDHLFASTVFLPYIKEHYDLSNLVIAAPDTGGTKRANAYAKYFDLEMAICYKQRRVANEVQNMMVIGDVKGKDVLLIDDIIDTAGTLCKAADLMVEEGAKSVSAMCSHPVLSGPAYERLEDSQISELVVTDTIPLKKQIDKIKTLTVSELFADVIENIEAHKSISSNFII
ncbi:ribose-phosphate pyrophosphokinase [Salibacter sp.]|jgi:ribose-phosphate pyrophosphokinase|uniref:ribose-phosphate diphosphokinase n=1 Tax=Salibacter sp. TaxID=2010995 RepID=UPI0028707565|nr:ribose-phosphate pyrophosphokinase [Salibacter sp.]MDR9397467.1 ribose-phosphate pyrophosphokinase [Salibacter sp.]MDR9486701.1 ribose-phosphate pyrophosphokinase [Salibacter sp.]